MIDFDVKSEECFVRFLEDWMIQSRVSGVNRRDYFSSILKNQSAKLMKGNRKFLEQLVAECEKLARQCDELKVNEIWIGMIEMICL